MNVSDNSTLSTAFNSTSGRSAVVPNAYLIVAKTFAWLVVPLFFLAVFGNTLIVIVMNKQKNRSITCSAYFSALAISDTLLVSQVSMERWIIEGLEINLYQYIPTSLGLKLRITAVYANVHLSSWILAAISLDRLVSVLVPHRSKLICNLVTARVTIALIWVAVIAVNLTATFVLINIRFIPGFGIKFDDNVPNGSMTYVLFDIVFGFLCPFIIIMSCSVGILIRLRKSMAINKSKSNRNTSATLILLTANASFVVTVLPFQVVAFLSLMTDLSGAYTLFYVTLFLSDCNAAVNFYVYILSGTRFRNDVKDLFCRTKLHAGSTLRKIEKSSTSLQN